MTATTFLGYFAFIASVAYVLVSIIVVLFLETTAIKADRGDTTVDDGKIIRIAGLIIVCQALLTIIALTA